MISLKELNGKIKSLRNTGKITKAMKLIAANRLTKSKRHLESHSDYGRALDRILRSVPVDLFPTLSGHPLLKPRKESEVENVALLLVSSQRGLCGPYNSNAIRLAQKTVQPWLRSGKTVSLHCFGKKGFEAFKAQTSISLKANLVEVGVGEHANIFDAVRVAKEMTTLYKNAQVDAVYLLYHDFASAVKQVPVLKLLLPFSIEQALSASASDLEDGEKTSSGLASALHEPVLEEVLEALVAKAIEGEIHRAFLNAQASEHASRMTAMDNATRNGEEMIEDYTLLKNRVRQASITTELSEVVSGAEALKG